jgi:2-iminobutanoate/2-iminopropanoate deaminase
MIRKVTTPEIPEPPPGMFSNCLVVGDTVYISGQHAGNPKGGILGDGSMVSQTRETLKKIKALIEAAGGSMADVVKLNVYVTDVSKRAEIGQARREFFSGDFPCSTLVEISRLVDPDLMIEIEATAIIGASKS